MSPYVKFYLIPYHPFVIQLLFPMKQNADYWALAQIWHIWCLEVDQINPCCNPSEHSRIKIYKQKVSQEGPNQSGYNSSVSISLIVGIFSLSFVDVGNDQTA